MKKFFSLIAALLFAGSIMATEYYLTGYFVGWDDVCYDDYHFAPIPDDPNEYILRGIRLPAGGGIKVMSPIEGSEDVTYYPSYAEAAENYIVPKWGAYDIYFRPNGDGEGEEWYHGYFRLQEVQFLDFEYATVSVSNEDFEDLGLTGIKLVTCDLDEYNTPTSNGILFEFFIEPDDPNDLNGFYSYQDWNLDVESSYLAIYENGVLMDTLFVDGEVTIVMTEIDQASGTAKLDLAGVFTSTEGDIFEFQTIHEAEYDYYVAPDPIDPDPQEEAVTNIRTDRQAIKSLKAGQVVIYKNGIPYSVNGQLL